MADSGFETQRYKALLKVRAKMLQATRSWLNKQGFIEVQGPTLLPAVSERPNSFKVNYFDKSAYLGGGLQPYSDVFLELFDKIYAIAPTFRAEPLQTNRHLTEYWRVEVAALKYDFEAMLGVQEQMLAYICSILARDMVEELTYLRGSIETLKQVKAPFPRLTYDESIEKLQNAGLRIFWGEQLDWQMENKLSSIFDQPFFITEFPLNGETFFYKPVKRKSELTLSNDLLAPEGYGEIAGGGEMITQKKLLNKKLNELEIDTADRRWYISLRKFNSTTQSGFALGVERLLQWICKLEKIKETTPFPRTYKDIYP